MYGYGRGEGEADKVVEWKHMEDRKRVAKVLEYACCTLPVFDVWLHHATNIYIYIIF